MKKDEVKHWEEKAVIYQWLAKYYQGQVEAGSMCIHEIAKYMRVDEPVLELEETAEYDFNRLFVGPTKLLAPPFESVYRSKDRLVMQAETLAVRKKYAEAGLEIQKKHTIPDDHMSFELVFLNYLLIEYLQNLEKTKGEKLCYLQLYQMFIKEHLSVWAFGHLQDVIEKAQTEYCRQVAIYFSAFLKAEKMASS